MTNPLFDIKAAKKTAQEIFVLGADLEDFTSVELINMLRAADDLYHNDQESFLTDERYDVVYRYTENIAPSDVYFAGVGSDVRGGKVKIPFPMGSLTQAYEGDFPKWVHKHNLAKAYVIESDKLDGSSTELLFEVSGDLQIAYSRGNGFEGADITRHISKIHNVPKNVGQQMVVRGEVILSEKNFDILRTKVFRRTGEPYKNARNMVAGLMNSSKNDPIVYDYLEVIAYQVIVPELGSKQEQFDLLSSVGFKIARYRKTTGADLTDANLIAYLNQQRETTEYEIDGLVIEVDDKKLRKSINPTRDTLNPEYARKFKIATEDNAAIATVTAVHWNVSKAGYLKPRVEIVPVELVGVTVTFATGFNAKFIHQNSIGPGAKIRITRSGDVIPFIQEVIEPSHISDYHEWFNNQLSTIGEWQWTETNVDAFLVNDHPDIALQKAKSFFDTIDAPYLGEGNIQKLFDAGFNSPEKIIKATEKELVSVLGENGHKIYAGMRTKLTNIPLYVIMDASGCFGRGVGTRKLKKLYEAFEGNLEDFANISQICSVEGFELKTAERIANGLDDWFDFWSRNFNYITVTSYVKAEKIEGVLTGQVFVFTGVRDANLEKQLINEGGEIASTFSKKVTTVIAADPDSNSGKIKKARDAGVKIISLDQAKRLVN